MSKPDDYLWDRSGSADPDVQRLEALLAPLAHDRPLDERRLRRPRSRAPWIAGAIALAAAAAVLVLVLRPGTPEERRGGACSTGEGYAFTTEGSPVACGGGSVASGVLPIGGTLDTGAGTARLAIADIGIADLGPGTRVRLDRSERDVRQQLHIERGTMHARVTAPPRIFAVTTPGSGVTDLGCEYTIRIDEKGVGTIEVQSGKVELETTARAVIVAPAGTAARMREGRQPSVPVRTDASPALRAAVLAYENGSPDGVDQVLGTVTPRDAITLANLAVLVADRTRVLERLAQISPPPGGIDVPRAIADSAALETWREQIVAEQIVDTLAP